MTPLAAAAGVWQDDAEILLEAVGVAPGWACVDVGCGAGELLAALARRCGRAGRVLGLDRDASAVAAARRRLGAHPHVEIRRGDLDDVDGEGFDLVHERLAAGADPDRVVGQMARLARPGGWVACQEADLRSWDLYPSCSGWDELKGALAALLGADATLGGTMPARLRAAGLTGVRVRAAVHALEHGHPAMALGLAAVAAVHDSIVRAGLLDARELAAATAGVRAHLRTPQTIQVTYTLVQVWGTRPATT